MAAHTQGSPRRVLITGGAGFIGSNLAARFMQQADAHVTIFDDLSRRGVEHNLAWLRSLPAGQAFRFLQGDIRDAVQVAEAATDATEIYHLAAQVAVTSSVVEPRTDFEVNALGTFNVLEAARLSQRHPLVFFTSTNKVYGGLETVPVHVEGSAYQADDVEFRGAREDTPLDFHSPYGCSKGAADQYVRDYARIYRLKTIVFRMSCIAGPRQFGNEDQGWVAHFLYSVLAGRPITIYGNGRQVRDILHVDDLVDAIDLARLNLDVTAGEIYNLGGGMQQAASVAQMLASIEQQTGIAPLCNYDEARPGDQPLYISDIEKIKAATGWSPRKNLTEILSDIEAFWDHNRELIGTVHAPFGQAAPPTQPTADVLANEVAS
ncbi:GDP-mannose 4,6-dehydratase [Acidipila sp. EB88]|uniref:GDP-mannose 4,6-dehydratase n=1 Tax=Acidipila sp. EB88 TaxID=2305226 RepID=UPI000F5D8796|nr:GDP-mannose 4,6-dehydratase [Acidipila sp. EB88]RRA49386.1 NAD-dependent epimerase/dehydratase family protein [Acidipila sp. EB88]